MYSNELPDPKYIHLDAKINMLCCLEVSLLRKIGSVAAILNFGCHKNSSRVTKCHQLDYESGHVQVTETPIKHHPDPKTTFIKKLPFFCQTMN